MPDRHGEAADRRVAGLEDQIRLAMQSWSLQPVVESLISLRGVNVITAVTVLAELGDLTRFDRSNPYQSYGLTVALLISTISSGAILPAFAGHSISSAL